MYEYACTFEFVKDSTIKWSKYSLQGVSNFCSEKSELWDWVDFSSDFYFENDEFEKLADGCYWCYVRGTAEFESDVDWESGIEEGHWLLGIDKLVIEPLEGDPND